MPYNNKTWIKLHFKNQSLKKLFTGIIKRDIFKNELKLKPEFITNYESFEDVLLKILNKQAPLKKKVSGANQAPYMTKTLRKAIMRRSELDSKYLKNKTTEKKTRFKKQNNFEEF